MAAPGYSTREVAKLVNLPESRIRAYARAGLVGRAQQSGGSTEATGDTPPSTERSADADTDADINNQPRTTRKTLRFDFHDLLVLRTAAKLLAQGLSPVRVQRALTALQRGASVEAPLAGAQLYNDEGRVIASDGSAAWHPESGQCILRFSAKRVSEASPTPLGRDRNDRAVDGEGTGAQVYRIAAVDDSTQDADRWFDMALELEEDDPQKAYDLYLRALAADPEHVEATINIGRLCSASGEGKRAAAYFRQATRMDPAHPVAHFNLAVTLHDMGELKGAAEAYRIALLHDPHFADAHYNLATLLEQQGEAEEAIRHFQAYRSVSRQPSQ